MPVLALEPYIYPDNIIDSELEITTDFIGDEEERWWTLHLLPRSEKSLSRRLLRDHISFFLPLYERRRRIQRRQVCSYLPLFPSYLFLRGGDTARRIAMETNLVVSSLFVEDQKKFLKDISLILRLMRSGFPLSPTERLQPGMAAEIISGPLAGIRGKILRKSGTRSLKFVIEVKFLQRETSVEVDSSMVQPLWQKEIQNSVSRVLLQVRFRMMQLLRDVLCGGLLSPDGRFVMTEIRNCWILTAGNYGE